MTDTFSDFVKANRGAFIWPVVSSGEPGTNFMFLVSESALSSRVKWKLAVAIEGETETDHFVKRKAFMRHVETGLFEP